MLPNWQGPTGKRDPISGVTIHEGSNPRQRLVRATSSTSLAADLNETVNVLERGMGEEAPCGMRGLGPFAGTPRGGLALMPMTFPRDTGRTSNDMKGASQTPDPCSNPASSREPTALLTFVPTCWTAVHEAAMSWTPMLRRLGAKTPRGWDVMA